MNLGRLAELPPEDLKQEWERRLGVPAPALSTELLRLGIGYKLQEARSGGINCVRGRRLKSCGQASVRSVRVKLTVPRRLPGGDSQMHARQSQTKARRIRSYVIVTSCEQLP